MLSGLIIASIIDMLALKLRIQRRQVHAGSVRPDIAMIDVHMVDVHMGTLEGERPQQQKRFTDG
jgi:hypothetical protein